MELASRMQDVVPAGITVTVEDDMLWFARNGSRRSGSHACQWVTSGQGSMDALAVRASELAINDLQDFVTEETTEPWPGSSGPPRPGVRLVGRTIELWFGVHDHPVVRLRPLPLPLDG
jgi:hypothetical protein